MLAVFWAEDDAILDAFARLGVDTVEELAASSADESKQADNLACANRDAFVLKENIAGCARRVAINVRDVPADHVFYELVNTDIFKR